jgi:hypothetical protein
MVHNSLVKAPTPTPGISTTSLSNITEAQKKTKKRKKEITFEDVQPYFEIPIKEASEKLGVSLTQLKRVIQRHLFYSLFLTDLSRDWCSEMALFVYSKLKS